MLAIPVDAVTTRKRRIYIKTGIFEDEKKVQDAVAVLTLSDAILLICKS